MKYLILLALVAFASAGQRPVWPRLPVGWKAPNDDSKIVGGEEVKIDDFKYQVALLTPYNFQFCGGSIISENVILTAAHCVYGKSPSSLKIRYGTADLNTGGGGFDVNVNRVIWHENYNSWTINNDVALLQLSGSVWDGAIEIAGASTGSDDFAGELSTTSGWGSMREGGSTTKTLRAVDVPVVTNAECKNAYGQNDITDGMICAGLPEGGKDACQGDSGGPLALRQSNGYSKDILIGVVSWGRGCARPDYPGVYARVSTYYNWICTNSGICG